MKCDGEVDDERWMREAIAEAEAGAREGEVPVGAVAVLDGQLIARDHNRPIQLHDPTAHAEVLVLREVGKLLGNYRLPGLTLYVTIEPCLMCTGAMIWARVSRVVFGVRDAKTGAVYSKADGNLAGRFNHSVEVREGVLEDACRAVMQEFFAVRRGARIGGTT